MRRFFSKYTTLCDLEVNVSSGGQLVEIGVTLVSGKRKNTVLDRECVVGNGILLISTLNSNAD